MGGRLPTGISTARAATPRGIWPAPRRAADRNAHCGRAAAPRRPDEALGRRPDRSGPDPVIGSAAMGRIGFAPIALAGLLVFDPHSVYLSPRPLADGTGVPVFDVAGDID